MRKNAVRLLLPFFCSVSRCDGATQTGTGCFDRIHPDPIARHNFRLPLSDSRYLFVIRPRGQLDSHLRKVSLKCQFRSYQISLPPHHAVPAAFVLRASAICIHFLKLGAVLSGSYRAQSGHGT